MLGLENRRPKFDIICRELSVWMILTVWMKVYSNSNNPKYLASEVYASEKGISNLEMQRAGMFTMYQICFQTLRVST